MAVSSMDLCPAGFLRITEPLVKHGEFQTSLWTFLINGNGERLDKIKRLRTFLR